MGQENIFKWGCLSAATYLNHSNRNLFCFTRRLIGCAVIKLFFSGISRQVCLFLKRGATQNDEDEDGQDPLSIAVQQANADIVTLYVYSLKTSSVKTFLCSFNAFLTSFLFSFLQAASGEDERGDAGVGGTVWTTRSIPGQQPHWAAV